MRLNVGRTGGWREKLNDVHSKYVRDVPETLVGDALLSPFNTDNHFSVQTCLETQCLLCKVLLYAELTDPRSNLLAAVLPSSQASR